MDVRKTHTERVPRTSPYQILVGIRAPFFVFMDVCKTQTELVSRTSHYQILVGIRARSVRESIPKLGMDSCGPLLGKAVRSFGHTKLVARANPEKLW